VNGLRAGFATPATTEIDVPEPEPFVLPAEEPAAPEPEPIREPAPVPA
jgi:hypothetical protein